MTMFELDDDLVPPILRDALDELGRICYEIAAEKGFHEETEIEGVVRDMTASERIALLHSEASELLEEVRKGIHPSKMWIEADGKPEGPAVEAADLLIRLVDFAHTYGFSLGEMVACKLAYNQTRPYRHNKKF